jgi:hypothetical protein
MTTEQKPARESTRESTQESILQEADRIAGHSRSRDYGHPQANFRRIANLWEAYFASRPELAQTELIISEEDVGHMLILMKVARNQNRPKRDNLVDIAGYSKCLAMIAGMEDDSFSPPTPARADESGPESPFVDF